MLTMLILLYLIFNTRMWNIKNWGPPNPDVPVQAEGSTTVFPWRSNYVQRALDTQTICIAQISLAISQRADISSLETGASMCWLVTGARMYYLVTRAKRARKVVVWILTLISSTCECLSYSVSVHRSFCSSFVDRM